MKERNVYNRLLIYHKKQTISKKIIESKNDTKQLFHLVNNITMSKTPNPMPEGKMNAQLAGEFTSFFLDKIEKSDSNSKTLINTSWKSMLQSQGFKIFYQWPMKK